MRLWDPEILAFQHYKLVKKLLKNTNINIEFLSGKTELSKKNLILKKLNKEKSILSLELMRYSEKINFYKLGYIVIDEQHKFGVRQRSELQKKEGLIAMFC